MRTSSNEQQEFQAISKDLVSYMLAEVLCSEDSTLRAPNCNIKHQKDIDLD